MSKGYPSKLEKCQQLAEKLAELAPDWGSGEIFEFIIDCSRLFTAGSGLLYVDAFNICRAIMSETLCCCPIGSDKPRVSDPPCPVHQGER